MRKLKLPADSVDAVFATCVSSYTSQTLKDKLMSVSPLIVAASKDFENKLLTTKTSSISSHDTVGGIVTKDEMVNVYDTKFVKGPGRPYYDRYLAAVPNNICPLCGIQIVSTLDHYLPKAKYPALSVTPANLVPSCFHCNLGSKKAITPSTPEKEPLHPYFDNVENCRWLTVDLKIVGTDLVPSYHASKPSEWNDLLFHRAQYHLKIYKLAKLYSIHAAEEISNCTLKWKKIYSKCESSVLHDFLIEDMESRENTFLNSWQSALYRSLVENTDTVCTWLDSLP